MKRALPFLIIAAVLVGAAIIAWGLKQSAVQPPVAQPTVNSSQTAAPAPPKVGEAGAEPAHSKGDAKAPITLEEFGDFQCPPCAALHPVLKTMEQEFGPRIRVVFREWPLPAHQHALAAARSAEAAGLQGKFWEMHHLLYENQATWSNAFDVRPIFEGFAAKAGVNVEKFKRDLSSETVAQRLFLDGKRGRSLGVQGTPTMFMNGREVPFESLPAERLRVVISNELKALGK